MNAEPLVDTAAGQHLQVVPTRTRPNPAVLPSPRRSARWRMPSIQLGGRSASGLLPADIAGLYAPSQAPLAVSRSRPSMMQASKFVLLADMVGLLAPTALASSGRAWTLFMTLIAVLLFQSGGLYRPQLHLSVLDEVPALLRRTLSALGITAVVLLTLLGNHPVLQAFLVLGVGSVISQLAARAIAYRLVLSGRARGVASHDTLLLGGGQIGADIAATLLEKPAYGLRPVGFLDDDPLLNELERPVPHLGEVHTLARVLSERRIGVLIVAFGSLRESALVDVLRASERAGTEVFVVPRLYEVHSHAGRTDHIGAIPVIRLRRPRLGSVSWTMKRMLDVAVSAFAIVMLAPVLLVVALSVRLEGGPGVLFRQQRIGRDGRPFELLKFRSMKPVNETESATNWNIAHDNRVGPVGKLLRRTSIDELPQLWNILRGEMSLVGPRPERPHFVQKFAVDFPRYDHRHRVPCGLTGLSQVSGLRGDTSIASRAMYDNFYIENWSFWLDLKILLVTAREVVGARGA